MNLRARATFLSEKADLVKTAVFWRFWGVLVQHSSQKQQTYEFSRENQYPRGWSSEKQLCSEGFEVYLRARATFLSETADLVKTVVFWRFWGVLMQLSSQKQQTYEFSRENQYPRGWSSEKTAVFWGFWGVSACACNFLLRNSRLTSSRGGIPFREDDLVNTAMFCRFWGESACACNFPLRKSGSSENSCVQTILRCARATFFSEAAETRVLDGESLSERMI